MQMHLLEQISGPTQRTPCRKIFFKGDYVGVEGGYKTFQAKNRDFMAIMEARDALGEEGLPATDMDVARWLVDNDKLDVRENSMSATSSRSYEEHVNAAYKRVQRTPKSTARMFVDGHNLGADKAIEHDATIYELTGDMAFIWGPYYAYYYPRD